MQILQFYVSFLQSAHVGCLSLIFDCEIYCRLQDVTIKLADSATAEILMAKVLDDAAEMFSSRKASQLSKHRKPSTFVVITFLQPLQKLPTQYSCQILTL